MKQVTSRPPAKPGLKGRSPGFFDRLSPLSRLKLLGFVFFTFAPSAILVLSPFSPRRSWLSLAVYAAFGGLTAAGWLYATAINRKALWILIPSQAFWFYLPRLFPKDFQTGFTLSIEGCMCIALIVTGYVLFVMFIRTEGTRAVRMQAELDLAQQIHETLIPPIDLTSDRLEVFGRSVAGAEMGGDLIDVVERDGSTDIFIADVSGHGVKAGVVMGVVKSAMRTRLRAGGGVGELLRDVNAVICELTVPEMFVTAACLRVQGGGQAVFCGAGHGPVLHKRHASCDVVEIESGQLPLGIIETEHYEGRSVPLDRGDVLLFMTDGLTEVFDGTGRMFGQAPIERILAIGGQRTLSELYEEVLAAVRAHGPQSDDQTLLLVRVL